MLNIYADLIKVFLTQTDSLNITVDKNDKVSIKNEILFLAGNKLAQTCQNFAGSTLPTINKLKGDFLYASYFDYNKVAFRDELSTATIKYAKAFNAENSEALIKEFITAFQSLGAMKMIGSMSMAMDEKGLPTNIDQEIVTFTPKAKAMIGMYEKMSTLMKNWNFAGTKTETAFSKVDFKVQDQDVYLYKTKTSSDAIEMVQNLDVHLSANDQALYISSNGKEGLSKLMQQKEISSSKPGVFWMKADYGSILKNVPTMPFTIPPVELTLKTKGNSANFEISF